MKRTNIMMITFAITGAVAIGCSEESELVLDEPKQELIADDDPATEEESPDNEVESSVHEDFDGTACCIIGDSTASVSDTLFYASESLFSGEEVPTEYHWEVIEGDIVITTDPEKSHVEVAFLDEFTEAILKLSFYSEENGRTPETGPYCSDAITIFSK